MISKDWSDARFVAAKNIVQTLRDVNDCADRAVKLIECNVLDTKLVDSNAQLAKNEDLTKLF